MNPHRMTRRTMIGGTGTALAGLTALMKGASAAGADEAAAAIPWPIPAWYYQHFDADYSLEVPEEGFGGWKKETLNFSREHTAVVVMHAWDAGRRYEDFPGWWRAVPYIPRANAVLREVFPPLLAAVRESGVSLFHVVGGGNYYKELPGYKHTLGLEPASPQATGKAVRDPIRDQLDAFRSAHVFVGAHNAEDTGRGFARLGFPPEARPLDTEGIAENGEQLFALCKEKGINHLIYCGFAINWCLLLSPGGMADMHRFGVMCSALRQATVAVENRETARNQACKEIALWRVALAYGFVFDVDEFVVALRRR